MMGDNTKGYRIFSVFNTATLVIIGLICVLPMLHILAVSLSSRAAATGNLVHLWPIGFNVQNYMNTLQSPQFFKALQISVTRTVLGTSLTMLLCLLAAYPMSKENHYFRGRTLYAWFFIITLLFNGGMIPTYLVVLKTGIYNTIWALMLPQAVAVFNVVVMLNFFRGLPKELDEAAQIDGASHFITLFRVYFPISLPSIATLSLFAIVGHWNSWFDGLIYVDMNKQPLATLIQSLVANRDFSRIQINPTDMKFLSERGLRAAQIFIGALPVLIVYPFLQKFFVQGMTLGSVKE